MVGVVMESLVKDAKECYVSGGIVYVTPGKDDSFQEELDSLGIPYYTLCEGVSTRGVCSIDMSQIEIVTLEQQRDNLKNSVSPNYFD